MKANPYVYPFIPFKNLANKNIKWQLMPREDFTFKKLEQFVANISFPIATTQGKSLEEKILSVFFDNNFLYGQRVSAVVIAVS